MPNFYTKNRRPTPCYSNHGDSRIDELVREVSFDAEGRPHISYKKVGERNLQEEIQSANRGISVYESIERAIKGDPLALNPSSRPDWTNSDSNKVNDLTFAPSSIHEATAVQQRANTLFASLPLELRELYGNSPERMLAEFTPESFAKAYDSLINPSKENPSNES